MSAIIISHIGTAQQSTLTSLMCHNFHRALFIDALLYDVAVTVNDWCFLNENNESENNDIKALDPYKYTALIKAYHAVRPITNLEKQHWISVLRIAALYFWVFRFLFTLHPPEGEQVGSKNAKEFQDKIAWYLENQATVQEIIDAL